LVKNGNGIRREAVTVGGVRNGNRHWRGGILFAAFSFPFRRFHRRLALQPRVPVVVLQRYDLQLPARAHRAPSPRGNKSRLRNCTLRAQPLHRSRAPSPHREALRAVVVPAALLARGAF